MRFFVISDNHDTLTGMRLAGIEGVVVHEPHELEQALREVVGREDIGLVLITELLVSLCPDLIYSIKLERRRPLLLEIPDRHSAGRSKDSIARYVREAIGVRI